DRSHGGPTIIEGGEPPISGHSVLKLHFDIDASRVRIERSLNGGKHAINRIDRNTVRAIHSPRDNNIVAWQDVCNAPVVGGEGDNNGNTAKKVGVGVRTVRARGCHGFPGAITDALS